MSFVSPEDISQLGKLIQSLRAGVPADDAREQVHLRDAFAQQVADGLAGKKVPAKAKRAAAELRQYLGSAAS